MLQVQTIELLGTKELTAIQCDSLEREPSFWFLEHHRARLIVAGAALGSSVGGTKSQRLHTHRTKKLSPGT